MAFYFLWVAEDLEKVSSLETQIGRLKLEIINQEKILAEGPKLKARIQELEKKLQTMVAFSPKNKRLKYF